MIRVEKVSLNFGSTKVLDAVDLVVEKGTCVAVSGPSGNGKTTLLRLINGLEKPDSGTVSVDGIVVSGPNTDLVSLRRRVGMVFQRYSLFPHKSALENVMMGQVQVLGRTRVDAASKARDLMNALSVAELADRYPNALSAGQQQRVALARTLAMDPDVLLLDEVTAALDPGMAEQVARLLRAALGKGVTILASSHDTAFVRHFADVTTTLEAGRLSTLQTVHSGGRPYD